MSLITPSTLSKDFSKVKPTWLTTVGILLALSWLLITLLQEDPEFYLLLGGLNLITTVLARFVARKKDALELEGGVIGFLVSWVLAFFIYNQKAASLEILEWVFQVNEIMVIYLVILFLAWFIITPRKTTQELVLNLPPFYSNFLLNLWKLSVVFLFLVTLKELQFLSDIGILFFLICGYFELGLYYSRQLKVNYIDIILNPIRLLTSLVSGPIVASKWILLTIIFILLNFMDSNIGSLGLIFVAVFIGLISLITSVTKLFLSSGIIESRVQEGKTYVPLVLEEIQEMASVDRSTQVDEFYEVPSHQIKKQNEIITFNPKDLLFRLHFSSELENKAGIFIFHLNKQKMLIRQEKDQRWKKWDRRNQQIKIKMRNGKEREIKLQGTTFHRISREDWAFLKEKIQPVGKDVFATMIGYSNSAELDAELAKIVQGTVLVQEQIRSRLRGVPAPRFEQSKRVFYGTTIENASLAIPPQIIEQKSIKENQDVEIIPGKDEFIFYARITRTDENKRKKKEIPSFILITGAGKGLGFSLTKNLIERGHKIFAIDNFLTEELTGLRDKHTENLFLFEVDVTKENEVRNVSEEISKFTPMIDILINSAGIYLEQHRPEVDQIGFEAISKTIETNAIGPLKISKNFLPLLRKSDNYKYIINISSEAGSVSSQTRESEFGYCMAKAALNMQSKILQNSLKDEGIKVLAIAPGWFSSEMGGPEAPLSPEEAAENVIQTIFLEWTIDDPIFVDTNADIMSW
jgi:NAD(P)-dependent dehydrogenase (short-subunit alcohol dehydrogenase family)